MSGACGLTRMSFAVTIRCNSPPPARYRCKPQPPAGVPSRVPTVLADVPLSRQHAGTWVWTQRLRSAAAHPNVLGTTENLRDCERSREQLLPAREVSPIADATGGCSFSH